MSGGNGYHHPRPWRAEPMDPTRPDWAWRVVCASKSGRGEDVVANYLSEADAVAIAAAPERAAT